MLDFSFLKHKPEPKVYKITVQVDGQDIPINLSLEGRNSVRFSFTHRGVYMRAPMGIGEVLLKSEIERLTNWLNELKKKKPNRFDIFAVKVYQSGEILTVGKRQYQLILSPKPRKSVFGKRSGYTINIDVPESVDRENPALSVAIKSLLSSLIGSDFHHEIHSRLIDLNEQHFNAQIDGLQLKYQSSRWGSCSDKRIITLSTRVLFAPDDVIDYVLIHELAHLKEMNHSDRFWALVETAMPNFQEKEKWLKINGPICDF